MTSSISRRVISTFRPRNPAIRAACQPVRVGQIAGWWKSFEALPGRPITGERVVRPDGTISLGYYGDLTVVGLNRDQIKVKLIEKLRTHLSDSVLGLYSEQSGKVKAIPPLQSDRVFVNDQPERSPTNLAAKETAGKRTSTASPRPASGPVPVKVGQTLAVEVLEALPGRPITGERDVRSDGTISLGFYGDMAVAGLTRDQIKVKVIEHLRRFLNDEKLGLRAVNPRTQQVEMVTPLQSDRVFVEDDLDLYNEPAAEPTADGKVQVRQTLVVEVLEALPGRPITGERIVGPDGMINLGFYGDVAVAGLTRDQIKVKIIEHLRGRLTDEQLGLITADRQGRQKAVAPVDSNRLFVDDAVTRRQPFADEAVKQLRGLVNELSGKLEAALEAIERLRREANAQPAKVEPARSP